MKITRQKLTAILIMAFLIAVSLTAAAMAAAIGKITAFEGNVDILRRGQERAAPVMRIEEPVSEGDIVRTKSNGKTEITFTDNSVIRLAPGTRLQITEYLMEGNKRKSGVMNLFRGKVRAVVSKSRGFLGVAFGGGNRFEVRTPTAVAGVKGTDFFVFYNMGVTGIVVTDGKVDTFNPQFPNQVVPVRAGNATFIAGDKPPSAPRPANDVEVIRHTHDTDPGEKPKEGDSTGPEFAGGPPAGGTFGNEAPGGAPPLPTGAGGGLQPPLIPDSEFHPELLSDITPPVISDITPPVISITGPSPYTNLSTAAFTVTYDEPVTATYTMGSWGATATATTSDTFSIASLPEGNYTITVTATDAAGNVSTQTYSWTTDYTAPALSGLPASITNVNSTSFGVTDANPVTYTLDGAAVSSTSFPVSEGAHTFTVTDAAGNSSSYSWMTDYGAPSVTYAASPTGIITFTGSDPTAAYSYDIDGVILTNQTSIFSGIVDGNHTLTYTATDPAGNTTTGTLSFLLSNSTINGLASGTGSILTGTSTGTVTAVYGQSWGGWTANINGTYTGTSSSSWQLVSGGRGYDSLSAQNGYWIDKTTGAYSGNIMTGTSNLTYLTRTTLGTGAGTISGSYDSTLSTFSLTETGSFTETPLDFSGDVYGGLLWYDPNFYGGVLRYANTDLYDQTWNVQGIIGGVGDLWNTGTANVYLMGTYNTYSGAEPYLVYGSGWHINYDPTISGYSSTIGGAFSGYTVGLWNNGAINTNTLAIYIDPNGNAGYLSGPLAGNYYAGINMWEMSGILSTEFVETTTILPADLSTSLNTGVFGWYNSMAGDFGGSGSIASTYIEGSLKGLAGLNWGIWNSGMGGSYTGQSGTNMLAQFGGSNFFDTNGNYGYMLGDIASNDWGIYGNTFSGSMNAQFMTPYLLGNMTGDIVGTYDYLLEVGGYWQSAGIGKWNATPLAWSGDTYGYYYYYYYGYLEYYDSKYGIFGATTSPFANPGTPVTLYAMGQAYPYGYSTWWDDIEGGYDVDTNSHWYGWLGGATNPVTNAEKGMLKALYIDANGNAGILTGDFAGNYYPDLSMWESTSGTLTANQKVAAGVYDPAYFWSYVQTSYPDGYAYGQFAGNTGSIQLGDDLQNIVSDETATYWFVNPNTGMDEPWGIYKLELGGYYDNPSPASTFSMDIGGNYWKSLSDYWLAHISGNWNSDYTIDGTVTGRYLTPYALGDITGGNMLGSYDTYTAGTWEGVAMGEFTEQPLAFSGIIKSAADWPHGPYYGLYGNFDGFNAGADVSGLIGGITSPWSGSAVAVVYMGRYDTSSFSLSQYIWNDDIYSYNANNSSATTYDNGAFSGFIGGVFNNKTINARVISLYIDPNGNAGYIKGSLAGTLYPELGYYNAMFEADGTWTATQMATAEGIGNILPADLYYTSVTDSSMTANVAGTFGTGSGYINGSQDYGWTRYIDGQNWGIYDLIIDGYQYPGYSNPNNDTTWSAKIGGTANFGSYFNVDVYSSDNGYYLADITSGALANGELTGSLGGQFMTRTKMGTITGDLVGYYDGSGNWAGTSLGVYEGTPLAWSGDVTPDSNTNVAFPSGAGLYSYDSSNSWLDIEGNSTGIMGYTASLWSDTNFKIMGAYDVSSGIAVGPPYLWTPEINMWGSATNNWGGITASTGAYQGFIGGVWKSDGTIEANVYSLYVDPDGKAGILKGNVTGTYYPALNMFEADGTWTPTTLATGLNAATATYNVVSTNYGYNITSLGDFNGAGSIAVAGDEMLYADKWMYSIAGQDWGIEKTIIGGDYTGTPSDTWSLATFVDFSGYSTNTIYGTQTDGSKWSADVSGNNVLKGQTYGYGADITNTPMTWISVGETNGTFDPAAYTWQAVQTSAWLDTNKFLGMIAAGDTAKLAALNIPFAEVGRATLVGSGNGFTDLRMTDTIFFADNISAAPKIWATGSVTGSFTSQPALDTIPVTLSGNGLSADFNLKQWNTTSGNWMSTVTNGNIPANTMNNTNPMTFEGAAAGTGATITPGGITGTAAGVAK